MFYLHPVARFAVITVVPALCVEFLLYPLWLIPHFAPTHIWLPFLQMALTAVFIPLSLAVIGVRFVWTHSNRVACVSILLVAVILTILSYYFIGAASGKSFWHPDFETVGLIKSVGAVALIIALAPPIMVSSVRLATRNG